MALPIIYNVRTLETYSESPADQMEVQRHVLAVLLSDNKPVDL
jgi:hypothetical protein